MSALLKLIATVAIATAIASPSSAANWFNADGTLTPGAQKVIDRGPPCVGCVPFRDLSQPQTVMVTPSNYETTVISSTRIRIRSYSSRSR